MKEKIEVGIDSQIKSADKYISVGRRLLKVVEFYGDKPIDEILPEAIQYILDNSNKEALNARNGISSEL
jgi:hypothetical protein